MILSMFSSDTDGKSPSVKRSPSALSSSSRRMKTLCSPGCSSGFLVCDWNIVNPNPRFFPFVRLATSIFTLLQRSVLQDIVARIVSNSHPFSWVIRRSLAISTRASVALLLRVPLHHAPRLDLPFVAARFDRESRIGDPPPVS